MKLRVPLSTENELCGCQLVLRTSKSTGARGDVQNFGGCQAPAAPVLTQALLDTAFFKIVKKPSIVQEKTLPHMNLLGFLIEKKENKIF